MEESPSSGALTSRPRISRQRTRLLLACQRCRQRKQKCDNKLPSCGECARARVPCLTKDRLASAADVSTRQLPRGYIESLEAKARALEQAISEAASAAPQVSLDSNQQTEPRNEQEENEDQHDVADDIGSEIDFLSLNAMAEASTLSSHSKAEPFALSHIVKTAMEADNSDPTSSKPLDSSLKIFTSRLSPISSNLVKKLPQETAVEHLEHFFRYVHISYPFLHPSTVLQYYERVVLTESPQTLHQKIQSVLVHMVMAVGISATDDMAQYGSFFANHFFLVASQYLDDIFTIDNVETTQVLLLLALFSLFSPCGGSTWHFVALAMRRCVSLGFHRRLTSHARKKLSSTDIAQIKWLFWSTYSLDRFVSTALGRPFAIADADIDIEVPAAVDRASFNGPIWFLKRPHTHECGLHMIRYVRLMSALYKSSYSSRDEEILNHLSQWRLESPDMVAVNDTTSVDYFESLYWQAILAPALRRPFDLTGVDETKLVTIADAAVMVIESFYRRSKRGLFMTWLMGCTAFNSGVILIFCLQNLASFRAKWTYAKLTAHLAACSHILTTLASRWGFMKAYRDMFDSLAEAVKKQVEAERTRTSLGPGSLSMLDSSAISNRKIRLLVDRIRGNARVDEMVSYYEITLTDSAESSGALT